MHASGRTGRARGHCVPGREEVVMTPARKVDCAVERLEVSTYKVPTETPESDGTFAWDATTLVLVEAEGGGRRGLGYSYADTATARLVRDQLADVVRGRDALAVPGAWEAMAHAVRNPAP